VQATEIGFLRRVLGVTLRDKVGSCEICKAMKIEPLLRIERSKLRCFGNVSRMSHKRLARKNPIGETRTGMGSRGRPRSELVTTSPTLPGPIVVWSQLNYLNLLLTVRYFKSS